MPLAPEKLAKGLATVHYLYDLAVQQSRRSGLRQGAAILTFHDAVEMFLVLGLQHHGLYSDRRFYHFHEYWSELARANPPINLTRTMDTLNRARVSFKHHAIPPATTVVEETRVHVRDFLTENVPIVFGLNLEDVHLSMLVQSSPQARTHLETAERQMAAGEYDEAIGEVAYAFHTLLADHERHLAGQGGQRGFRLNPLWLPGRLGSASIYGTDDVAQLAGTVSEAIHELQVAVRVLSFGLDFARFRRFIALAPRVIELQPGQLNRTEWHRENEPPTPEECQSCYDFVVDSALRLEESV